MTNNGVLYRKSNGTASLSLGFILDKDEQLSSYGLFQNDKLHGFGSKYENNIKYEGEFHNGLLHGMGLRLVNGKYTFGRF